MKQLLRSVIAAKSAADYWAVQNDLASAIEAQEQSIRRDQRRHLNFRHAVKRCCGPSTAGTKFDRERIQRIQGLIGANERSEDNHRFARGAILYLGDTLAYNLMPDHVVRMCGRNSSPGFFGGKKGREKELQIGALLANDGWTLLLHDLTHCLRICDLTAFCEERGILRIECGAGGGERKQRQSRRMELLTRVLKEDTSTISTDELIAHRFPATFLETETELQHNTAAFCEVANCNATGWKVLQPEDGLIYAACLRGCQPEELGRAIARIGRGWRNYMIACFSDRIMGHYSWVPSIMSLPLPAEHVVDLLERRFHFWVFIDVDHVKRRLAKLSPELAVSDYGDHIGFTSRSDEWLVVRGPRPIENVQYGLASLETALQMLAVDPQFDRAEMFERQ